MAQQDEQLAQLCSFSQQLGARLQLQDVGRQSLVLPWAPLPDAVDLGSLYSDQRCPDQSPHRTAEAADRISNFCVGGFLVWSMQLWPRNFCAAAIICCPTRHSIKQCSNIITAAKVHFKQSILFIDVCFFRSMQTDAFCGSSHSLALPHAQAFSILLRLVPHLRYSSFGRMIL